MSVNSPLSLQFGKIYRINTLDFDRAESTAKEWAENWIKDRKSADPTFEAFYGTGWKTYNAHDISLQEQAENPGIRHPGDEGEPVEETLLWPGGYIYTNEPDEFTKAASADPPKTLYESAYAARKALDETWEESIVKPSDEGLDTKAALNRIFIMLGLDHEDSPINMDWALLEKMKDEAPLLDYKA